MRVKFLKKDLFFIVLILILSFPAIKTLGVSGFFETHDGHFHLVRLAHFYQTLKEGHFPVRWAEDLNQRYGSPLFNFNYPLTYYLGSLIHRLGFNFGDSLKIIMFLSFVLSGIFCFFWLKELFGRLAAFISAIFYIYAPYRFVSSYVSGRMGEVTAYIFIPLVFFTTTKFARKPNNLNLAFVSLAYALLILSYNVSALIFSPLILSYLVFLLFQEKKLNKKFLLKSFRFLLLAFSLSAFFWLPAILERKYVKLGEVAIYDYKAGFAGLRNYFYSPWGYGYEATGTIEGVSYQIGLGQILVTILSALLLIFLFNKKQRKKENLLSLFFFGWSIFIFFMMNRVSIPVWEAIPLLQTIQFPFRLLSMLILFASFFAGYLIYQLKNKKTLLVTGSLFLVTLVLYANRNHLRPGTPDRYPDEFYFHRNWLFYGSADVAGENTPVWNKERLLTYGEKIKKETEDGQISSLILKPRLYRFKTESQEEMKIGVNTLYYPGWQVLIDGKKTKIDYQNREGLIKFKVPSGEHRVRVVFKQTPLQKGANLLSLLSAILVLTIVFAPLRKKIA